MTMNVGVSLDDVSKFTTYYYPPVKNTVMDNSNFIRLVYSDAMMSLNSVYIEVPIIDVRAERHYNRSRFFFCPDQNARVIQDVRAVEERLLEGVGTGRQRAQYRVSDQLRTGSLRVFANVDFKRQHGCIVLLKISGIWLTDTEKGLTYKFSDGVTETP